MVDIALNAVGATTVIFTIEFATIAFAIRLVVVDGTTVRTRRSPAIVAAGACCQLAVVAVVAGAVSLFVGMASATFTVGVVVVGIATIRTSTVVGKDIVVTSVSAISVGGLCAAIATDVLAMGHGVRTSTEGVGTVTRVAAG